MGYHRPNSIIKINLQILWFLKYRHFHYICAICKFNQFHLLFIGICLRFTLFSISSKVAQSCSSWPPQKEPKSKGKDRRPTISCSGPFAVSFHGTKKER